MSLQGSLEHIQLHDVIQLVSVSGKSGVFYLKKGNQEGKIYLKNGNIVHAEIGSIKGEEAIYTLAVWSEGAFNFDPEIEPPEETIKKSNTNLLMEAARRMDEWKILRKKIPSTSHMPDFKPQPPTSKANIHLNTGEWLLLSKVNGTRSIEEISKETNQSVFDVCKILYGLITNNLIQLLEPPSEAIPPEKITTDKEKESTTAEQSSESAEEIQKEETTVSQKELDEKTEALFQELDEESLHDKIPDLKEKVEEIAEERKQQGELTDKEKILQLLEKIKTIAEQILGNQGRPIINQQFAKAKSDIERGVRMDVIKETITQIARASTILKGPSTTEMLLEQIKYLKIEQK